MGIVSVLSSTPLPSIPFHLRRNSINDLIYGLTALPPPLSLSLPLSISVSGSRSIYLSLALIHAVRRLIYSSPSRFRCLAAVDLRIR